MISFPLAEFGSVERTVVSALAVAGGFLAGYVCVNLVARGLCRFIFKSSPERFIRFSRLAGGAGGAILVYFLISGPGGLGLGGGPGSNPSNNDKNSEPAAPQNEAPKNQPKADEKLDLSTEEPYVVVVLKWDSPEKKFYRFDRDTTPSALEDVLRKIDDRAKSGKKFAVRIREGDPEYAYQAKTLLERRLQERGIEFSEIPSASGNAEKK